MFKKRFIKRHIVIDGILLTLIFSVFLSVLFIAFFIPKEGTFTNSSLSVEAYQRPSSTITEEPSSIETITVISEVAEDPYSPYTLKYPLTKHVTINAVISDYVSSKKQDYLQLIEKERVRNPHVKGELDSSFEIFTHAEDYISLLLKTNITVANTETVTSYQSFVIHNTTGELLSIMVLLNHNEQSLSTFAKQLQHALLKDNQVHSFSAAEIEQATRPVWRNFETFILQDGHLTMIYNTLIVPNTNLPARITIDLSSINPLLVQALQVQMAAPTITLPTTRSAKKLVALTFDDGPHPEVTPKIVTTLQKYNAKATFFMLGSRVEYYPEIVLNVMQDGHEIGNHTWNHPILTKLTTEQIIKEYTATEIAITNAIGTGSTIFRAPYGMTNSHIQEVIGGVHVNWTIDTEDWKHRSKTQLLPMIQKNIHPNAIILMHDIHLSTAEGLEAVLDYLQAEDFEFVTVSQLLQEMQLEN